MDIKHFAVENTQKLKLLLDLHPFQKLPLDCPPVTPVLTQQQRRQPMTVLHSSMVAWPQMMWMKCVVWKWVTLLLHLCAFAVRVLYSPTLSVLRNVFFVPPTNIWTLSLSEEANFKKYFQPVQIKSNQIKSTFCSVWWSALSQQDYLRELYMSSRSDQMTKLCEKNKKTKMK